MLAKLYKENHYRENRFYLNEELEERYRKIWLKNFPEKNCKNVFIEYPFYHLINDNIWMLKVKENKKTIYRN